MRISLQVVRNHELVGQVSLDQLQAAVGRMPEEEPSSNLELRNDDSEDEETEGFVTDCKEGLLETQAADVLRGGRTPQTEEASRERGWSGDMEESPIEGYVWDLQSKEAEPNTAALCMRQKEEEKAAEESSPTRGALSVRRTREKAVVPGAVTEAEAEAVDALVSPDGGGVPPSRVDAEAVSALAATNLTQADNSGSLGGATSLPTFSSKCAGAKTSDTENSGLSFKNCKEGQAQHQKNISAGREPYGEMPVLEKEYLKEELQPIGCCKEEDESSRLVPKREEEDTKDKKNRCTEPKHDGEGTKIGSPHVARGKLLNPRQ